MLLQVAEFCVQAALTVLLFVTGHWRFALCHTVMTAVCLRFVLLKQHLIDSTTIFKQASARKRRHIIIMLVYMLAFMLAGYR